MRHANFSGNRKMSLRRGLRPFRSVELALVEGSVESFG